MKKYKILIVEDDDILSGIMKDSLEDEGYEVVQAFDGEEGFTIAKTEKPDTILLDIIMPKLDGISLLKKLKADDEVKNIPVFIITVHGDKEDIMGTIDLGAESYFIKDQEKVADIISAVSNKLQKN